ncbi:MAG: hypothetical protein IKO74_03675 [Selenomonadaceae bacterium]|nr:hypothetical protein [Selenomonadaceae bacterium]
MNLKEAFQAQNKLEKLFSFASGYLDDEKNLISVTEKHFRSKAAEGQPDEKINIVVDDKFPPDKVIDFLMILIDEREKLARAIHSAKSSMQFDLDSAVDVNKKRHAAAETLRGLRNFKSSSLLEKMRASATSSTRKATKSPIATTSNASRRLTLTERM